MSKFIKVPDGIIRTDLIKRVIKTENDRCSSISWLGVKVVEEVEHHYKKEHHTGCNWNNIKEWRDELYEDIEKQLFESETEREVEKDD